MGSRNYDVVSLHLDHYRTVDCYNLRLAIASPRQDLNVEDVEGGIVEKQDINVEGGTVEELKQPLITCMDA